MVLGRKYHCVVHCKVAVAFNGNTALILSFAEQVCGIQIGEDSVKLNFNEMILSDITNNVILEEVMYTIGLSICDELSVDKVIFEVGNKEISTFSLKTLD